MESGKERRRAAETFRIHLAFRFHVNFYHSYRGDSLDERGIGKDIRIISGILDDLDRLNREGVPVRGTWDIENYYSIERMMSDHAPELLARIRSRVRSGTDEAEAMSYNNGLNSACTAEEFEEQLRLTKANEARSGLSDVFGSWAHILRPQECMYTPSFLERYPAGGIGALSLYYSAVPFNGFSTLVPPLPVEARYNPLTLRSRSLPGSMTLLPCYNNGDVADRFLSLRRWLLSLRRRQLRMEVPKDLLLLIDHDGDDEFWAGMDIPVLTRLFPSFDGLYRMVRSVADLPFLRFDTPGSYLAGHGAVAELFLDQDTADGSFDGYSSWAEKWENTELWTVLHRAREAAHRAGRLLAGAEGEASPAASEARRSAEVHLASALRSRLLALSTTHFGMASPVMNVKRLEDGFSHARAALSEADSALALLRGAEGAAGAAGNVAAATAVGTAGRAAPKSGVPALFLGRGYGGGGARGVARLSGEDAAAWAVAFPGLGALWIYGEERHAFVPCLVAAGDKAYASGAPDPQVEPPEGAGYTVDHPWLSYGNKTVRGRAVGEPEERELGGGSRVRIVRGVLGENGEWTRAEFRIGGSRGVFYDLDLRWPRTEDRNWKRGKAARLDRTWDGLWKEVAPLEVLPRFAAAADRPFRVFKRNFFGDRSSYSLDYHRFSGNRRLASCNNHLTNGWIAFGNGERGLVLAQYGGLSTNFAFCPLRSAVEGRVQRLRLNPFGTYYGPQWRYPTAVTGLGRALALVMADQLDSYAPSFNGARSRFSVGIWEFEGPEPPEDLLREAELYAAGAVMD